jgi:C4-dicarboxylate-specific signal transduction histidine kinase
MPLLTPKPFLRGRVFTIAAGLASIAIIAFADRVLNNDVPLALLYLLPVVLISTALARWQIVLLGAVCTVVAELSDAFHWVPATGVPRDTLYFFAYTAAGLYVSEVVSSRRRERLHLTELESEMEARRGVEEQLQLVVANSSIAILTVDEAGLILNANATADKLFADEHADEPLSIRGGQLRDFLPSLARVKIRKEGWQQLRTMMQCQGMRAGREPFLADVWFSTYMSSDGGRLTAMIVDSSVETRDREEANLEQVLVGSRLAIGAMAHEIRNICAAISVVQQNLRAAYPAHIPEDVAALGQLVAALERIASVELSLMRRQAKKLELDSFLRELFIIIHPSLREAGIALEWHVGAQLPEVLADQHSLLQVFLNLVRNAEAALAGVPDARICLRAARLDGGVQIVFSDNGSGVRHPEELFQPFRNGSGRARGASGLGLYLSRAMMLSFHGDLRHQPTQQGASFLIEMLAAEGNE